MNAFLAISVLEDRDLAVYELETGTPKSVMIIVQSL